MPESCPLALQADWPLVTLQLQDWWTRGGGEGQTSCVQEGMGIKEVERNQMSVQQLHQEGKELDQQ